MPIDTMPVALYISYFLLAIASLRFGIVVYNALSKTRLPKQQNNKLGKLSVLIPARNEEENINYLLADISKLHYPDMDVWVYDDQSTDNTLCVAQAWKKKLPELNIIRGKELPAGWKGKNYACHQLAEKAQGQYLLFLDADVRIQPGLPERALQYLMKHNLHLLSIFPTQTMHSRAEKCSVPLINWLLLTLLPIPLVRICRWKVFSAANGQFMLFRADSYRCLQAHAMVREHVVEDIALTRMYKYLRLKVGVLLGNQALSCRMYHNHETAFEGFSKFILHIFGNNRIAAILFSLYSNLAALLMFLLGGYTLGILFLGLFFITRMVVARLSHQSVLMHFRYMIHQQWFLFRIVFRMAIIPNKTTLTWKERAIS